MFLLAASAASGASAARPQAPADRLVPNGKRANFRFYRVISATIVAGGAGPPRPPPNAWGVRDRAPWGPEWKPLGFLAFSEHPKCVFFFLRLSQEIVFFYAPSLLINMLINILINMLINIFINFDQFWSILKGGMENVLFFIVWRGRHAWIFFLPNIALNFIEGKGPLLVNRKIGGISEKALGINVKNA